MFIRSLLFSFCVFSPFLAHASFYVGGLLNYGVTESNPSANDILIDANAQKVDGSTLAIFGQGGYYFNDYTAAEVRIGSSVTGDDGNNLDTVIAGYGKLNLPITSQVAIYFLGGYAQTSLSVEGSSSSTSTGFSAGGGIHYAFDRKWAMTVEYLNILDTNTVSVDGFSLAIQYKF